MPTAHERTTADDRRLAVLIDVARSIDTDGAPPTQRDLAARYGVSKRAIELDVEALISAGMLRELGAHQPRQRARLAVTEDGQRAIALAASPTAPPETTLSAEHPEQGPAATPSLFSHAQATTEPRP